MRRRYIRGTFARELGVDDETYYRGRDPSWLATSLAAEDEHGVMVILSVIEPERLRNLAAMTLPENPDVPDLPGRVRAEIARRNASNQEGTS